MSSYIRTVPELIAHFGGPQKLATVLGTYIQMVSNWRRKGYIPAIHYRQHIWLLRTADPLLQVSDDLWGFGTEPSVRRRRGKAEMLAAREAAE